MTKEVVIAVKGLQFGAEEEQEEIESITIGNYYEKNGSAYVLYEELIEGFEQPSKNRLKFNEKELSLIKKGPCSVQMIFQKNQKNMSSYGTPFGNIMVGVDTKEIEIEKTESKIHITVAYELEVNYQYFADCRIDISILAKEEGNEFLVS